MASACSGEASRRSSTAPTPGRPSTRDSPTHFQKRGDRTMTDVRDAETTTSTNDNGPNPPGDYIWYELITPDPVAAKAFYDAVVGWTIEPQPSGEMDYRMI